ncbi:MAG TPA: hypothetical protein VFT99_15170, partial [Roseiflexaceae bacterium]|nr:hypothetical protein [Roseiflexaceae bacterium]
FGSTVNIAARVQSESIGEDIVITEAMMADPGVERILNSTPAEIEEFSRNLKGFSRSFALWRITLPEVAAAVEETAGADTQPAPLNEGR